MALAAKPDTVLLVAPQTSQTADLSQYATNLTAADLGGYELNSTRCQLDGSNGRSVAVRIDADTASVGTVFYLGDGSFGGAPWYLYFGAAKIRLYAEATTLIGVTPPGLSGTPQTYAVQASTRPNPLSTGPSDAQFSEVIVINEGTGAVAMLSGTHQAYEVLSTDDASYAGRWNVSTLDQDYSDTIYDVRIGRRFASTQEFFEEITESTSTGSGANVPEVLTSPPSTIGQDGEGAGPAYAFAGAQVGDSHRRLLSPLVNVYNPQSRFWGSTWSVYDEITGQGYVAPNSTLVPGFDDGPGGSVDRSRSWSTDRLEAEDADLNAFLNGSDFIISCWVYLSSTSVSRAIFAQFDGTDYGIRLGTASGGAVVLEWSDGGTERTATSTATLSTGTWNHIGAVVTHTGSNRTGVIFINATSDGSVTGGYASLNADNSHCIGGITGGGLYWFGRISSLAIQEFPATGDAAQHFDAESQCGTGSLLPIDDTGGPINFKRYWRFNQTSDGYYPAQMFRDIDLGGTTYKAHANLYWRRRVPRNATHARVRVHVETVFHTTGTSDSLVVAVVSTTQRPGTLVFAGASIETYYTTETVAGVASSEESMVTFSTDLKLARDANDLCHLFVATRIPSHTGDTDFRIKAVSIVPYSKTQGSSFPITPGG